MTEQQIRETIEALRDDDNYYGELGRRFLSNSDISTLVNDPDLYGQGLEDGTALLKGGYLHTRILEPEKVKDIVVVDASTRTTKIYKEFVAEHTIEGQPKPVFLLKKEVQELEALAMKIELNDEFVDALQIDKQEFEVEEPMIGEIFGYWFKGKADRINRRRGLIADLKTTRSLSSFESNFKKYGYHSQAYIYEKLFGLPVRFYVIDKTTGRLGVYDISEATKAQAEDFIRWGLDKLEMYYAEEPTEEIDQYYRYKEI